VVRGVLAASFACLLGVQQPPAQVFRTGVDVVTVDVIVTDKSGKAIADLRPEDFTVTADGKPRSIKSARFYPIAGRRSGPAGAGGTGGPAASSSNARLAEARSIVIVADTEQIDLGQGRAAARGLADFVATLPPGDRVGLVALPSGHPRVELTTNRKSVQAALGLIVGAANRRGGHMSLGEAAHIERGDVRMIDVHRARIGLDECRDRPRCIEAERREAVQVMDDERRRSRNVLDALRSLADAMGPLPGLKAIVLVSEGMVYDSRIRNDLDRFGAAAARSRVLLFALNLDSQATQASDGSRLPPDRALDSEVRLNGQAVAAIAAGGETFRVSGTPLAALQRIDDQLSGYYLLGFEVEPSDRSSRTHGIDVRVRNPDATVRARTRFALPAAGASGETPPTPAADLRARMGETLRWPAPIPDVPIEIATFASPPAPKAAARRVIVAADLPASIAAAAIGFELVGEDGRPVADAFELDPALASAGATRSYLAAVTVDPGRYQLRFGVLTGQGQRGSVEHWVVVPPAGPGPLQVGDLVIGYDGSEGFGPVASAAGAAAPLVVQVELQAESAGAFDGLSARLEIANEADAAALVAGAPMEIAATADPLRRVARATVAFGRLPAADYVLRCTVESPGTQPLQVSRVVRTR
jgi:VWFA-related protein